MVYDVYDIVSPTFLIPIYSWLTYFYPLKMVDLSIAIDVNVYLLVYQSPEGYIKNIHHKTSIFDCLATLPSGKLT